MQTNRDTEFLRPSSVPFAIKFNLLKAAKAGNLPDVQNALQNGARLFDYHFTVGGRQNKMHAFEIAAKAGHSHIVEFFLDTHPLLWADIVSAFYLAGKYNHENVLSTLIASGIYRSQTPELKRSAFMTGLKGGLDGHHIGLVEYFKTLSLKQMEGFTTDLVVCCIDYFSNKTLPADDQVTHLLSFFRDCACNRTTFSKVAQFCSVCGQYQLGLTTKNFVDILEKSSRCGWTKAIHELLHIRSFYPGAENTRWMDSSLVVAILEEHLDTVRALIHHGANPSSTHSNGREQNLKPIHFAASCSSAAILQYLIELNPQGTKQRTNLGNTPIHIASMNLKISNVLLILENGGSLSERCQLGVRALDYLNLPELISIMWLQCRYLFFWATHDFFPKELLCFLCKLLLWVFLQA